tara:strand:+ start:122 stop:343 length:222 start_codon:yes stop_codon:yes gene_type:complete
MWWFGFGVLAFIWFIFNGDEFYEGLKERDIGVILLHLLVILPLGFFIYGAFLAPFIEMLWTQVEWSSVSREYE